MSSKGSKDLEVCACCVAASVSGDTKIVDSHKVSKVTVEKGDVSHIAEVVVTCVSGVAGVVDSEGKFKEKKISKSSESTSKEC